MLCSLAMKAKRTLPPGKVARRPRGNFQTSQKKDREAIDAAFKRKIGDDGFRPQGAFGRKEKHPEASKPSRFPEASQVLKPRSLYPGIEQDGGPELRDWACSDSDENTF
jgi:hypothetical protein